MPSPDISNCPSSPHDGSAAEVGGEFTSATSREITGIRVYKNFTNTGPHTGDLWSSKGVLLADAVFTNKSASEWQQVNFATPLNITTGATVAITAGFTYVASSFRTAGEYSVDPNLFATTLTNGPLTAPSSGSSGGNGVYAYGSSSPFPTNSLNSTSYGLDVVFKPQLAG